MLISLRGVFDSELIPDEWLLERLRIQRNILLASSDWTQVADAPVNQKAWAEYRQALRDFPNGWIPASEVDLPEQPTGDN